MSSRRFYERFSTPLPTLRELTVVCAQIGGFGFLFLSSLQKWFVVPTSRWGQASEPNVVLFFKITALMTVAALAVSRIRHRRWTRTSVILATIC